MNRFLKSHTAAMLYGTIAVLAIIVGGLFAAFSAHNPSQFALWATAYLVLIEGIAQIGFVAGLYAVTNKPFGKGAMWAFAAYNVANFGVLFGTYIKDTSSTAPLFVNSGGVLLAVSMIMLLYVARNAKRTRLLYAYYFLVGVILVSMPIGLLLANR